MKCSPISQFGRASLPEREQYQRAQHQSGLGRTDTASHAVMH